ncbi:MAG: hypothetical protein ACTHK7_05685, partial [Aureliella sp.]
ERDLMTEELRFIGHTDWRGVIRIERPEQLGGVLPEAERLKRVAARKAAAEAAALAAEARTKKAKPSKTDEAEEDKRGPSSDEAESSPKLSEPVPGAEASASAASAPSAPSAAEPAAVESDPAAGSVPLRQPLVLLYVKSGDTVMARLPLVPGLNEVDMADLPSDARRLEAEAMLRGFQGEILDLIAKRALLSARVSRLLSDKEFSKAQEVIGEVRRLPDYKTLSDELDGMQRRLLDESEEPIPMVAKSRIDRMTQTTRDMLQKYLENDLVQKLTRDMEKAKVAAAEEEKAAAKAAAEEEKAAAAKAAEKPKDDKAAKDSSGTRAAE